MNEQPVVKGNYNYSPLPGVDTDIELTDIGIGQQLEIEESLIEQINEIQGQVGQFGAIVASAAILGSAEAATNHRIEQELEEYKQAHVNDPVWNSMFQQMKRENDERVAKQQKKKEFEQTATQEPVANEKVKLGGPGRNKLIDQMQAEGKSFGQSEKPKDSKQVTIPGKYENTKEEYTEQQMGQLIAAQPQTLTDLMLSYAGQIGNSILNTALNAFLLYSVQSAGTREFIAYLFNNSDRIIAFVNGLMGILNRDSGHNPPPVDSGTANDTEAEHTQHVIENTRKPVVYEDDFIDHVHIKEPDTRLTDYVDDNVDFVTKMQQPLPPQCKRSWFIDDTGKYRTRVVCIDQRGARTYYDR